MTETAVASSILLVPVFLLLLMSGANEATGLLIFLLLYPSAKN